MRVWVVVLVLAAALPPLGHRRPSRSSASTLTKHQMLNMDMTQLNTALILLVGALGLNLVTGYTGMISIGNAGFFALGAIVASATGIKSGQLPFPVVILLLAGIAGAVVGALVGLPALRIRGIYLLLATLGFHYVMMFLFLRVPDQVVRLRRVDFLRAGDARSASRSTPRSAGTTSCSASPPSGSLVTKNLLRTRQGRSLVAVRDHEVAAATAGINVAYARIMSFSVSSFMITAAGATVRLVPRLGRRGHVSRCCSRSASSR